MHVQIETLAPKHVAYIRHTGPYTQVGPVWGRLFSWAAPKGLLGPHMEYFGLCYDDPDVTPPDRLRYDACLVVGPGVKPENDFGVQDVDGGSFATTVHTGPYRTLGATYSALCGAWLPSNGRRLGPPPSVEFYLNDPRSTPEEQLRTRVCVRLA